MFFLIGLRRSRTTLLKKLVEQSPDRPKICFEPHDFYYAMAMSPMKRYKGFKTLMNEYTQKYDGFKFALNPGICALEWQIIPELYPKAKFIFIIRDISQTYNSYFKQDLNSYRGIISKEAYEPVASDVIKSFRKFVKHNNQGFIIEDHQLIKDPLIKMNEVWDFLNLARGQNISNLINGKK